MLASHNWLMELTGLSLTPSEVARRLTAAGLEVEGTRSYGAQLAGVVVAEVRGLRPHPARENLRLVTVFDGAGEQEVVCGAPNVPAAPGLVAFARLQAVLPNGMKIEERKLGGVISRGMICSEAELDLGADGDGILILEPAPGLQPGAALAEALALRDTIYDISLTPNRPDCLGHVGIARELCAVSEQTFTPPQFAIERQLPAASGLFAAEAPVMQLHGAGAQPPDSSQLTAAKALAGVRVEVIAKDRCPRYGVAAVLGVTIAPSPFAQRYRLHTLGLRAISNVVDATNLILLGWGQPIHAFDLEHLRGRRIEVRLARNGESLKTLDAETRPLTDDDLLICDGEGPIALAGVMGGANSEIGPTTRHVLIECAYFDPRSVRRTSKRLGLHTDASHRFERGADPQVEPSVLAHAAQLIAAVSGGVAAPEAIDAKADLPVAPQIQFRSERAQRLLGTPVDLQRARGIFERLGCTIARQTQTLDVIAPSFRPDLTREVDLIEEYARVSGYDSLPTELPRVLAGYDSGGSELALVRRLREAAAALGLAEAINYAFVASDDLRRALVPPEAPRVQNPMSEERSVLRTALLPGLLQNLGLAQRHQLRRFAGFELARVFEPRAAGELPDEHYELGILLWGLRADWYDERESLDFYDAKGVIESLTQSVLGEPARTLRESSPLSAAAYLHPRRSAGVSLGEVPVGVVGELHPAVVENFDLSGRPVYAQLDLRRLAEAGTRIAALRVRALPRFPASTRDLAVVVAEALAAGEVSSSLLREAPELLESVTLFDIYRGAPVPEGHKSLAFHLVYRDPAATLTDKRVDDAHARVAASAEQRFSAALRK
jgi:phenylalanyl-tRNA synthetase beta chain